MPRINCELFSSYAVEVFDSGLFEPTTPALRQVIGERLALIVTTPTVDRLYGAALRRYLRLNQIAATINVFQLSEQEKSIENVLRVCALAKQGNLGRQDLLIAFGGGVCSDIVTLAASLIRRGIPYACLPTTLIAQVDAAVGLKGAINFGGHKNYLGCFKSPAHVLVDPTFLQTLPPRLLRCGMAEILKVAMIRDYRLLEQIERYGTALIASGFASPPDVARAVIERSIELMLNELETNAYEDKSFRRLVDFGHTFSPALEASSGYAIHHGEAVAIDMALSSALAVELGLLGSSEFERILVIFSSLGLPYYSDLCDLAVLRGGIAETTRHRAGTLNLVVPCGIGAATFVARAEEVDAQLLLRVIDRLRQAQTPELCARTN